MSNIITFQNLEAPAPYRGMAVSDFLANIREMAGKYEFSSDALALSGPVVLSTTVQSAKSSAGRLYAVQVVSPSGASNPAYVQVFNVASGGVTLGTTSPDMVVKCPAGETVVMELFSAGSANVFGTAISYAAATTGKGNSALASADQPTVTLLYA